MKDNSTLRSLNRKLEAKFKEAHLYLSRLENILSQRREAEDSIIDKINLLNQELNLAKDNRNSLFLSGFLKAESIRVEQIKSELIALRGKLLVATSECSVAEDRIESAKLELEMLYKEREGLLRIEDERETQNERIKVETTDSN